jgi:pyroglutamyl-peptidase
MTGFEPFGNFTVNPSWEAAKVLNGREIKSFKIKSFKIPLDYREIKHKIESIIDKYKPGVLINLGQSPRPVISLEKVALNFANLSESNTPYNCGSRPFDELLEANAPAAYFTNLPIRKILDRLRETKIPSEISYNAGTFGCNQIFFSTMNKIIQNTMKIIAGFIHVPSLPSQAAAIQESKKKTIPSMDLHTIIKALEISIETTLETMTS